MIKIRRNDAEKVAFGIAGMAGSTLAMRAIEKAIASQTVKGLLGLDGVATLQEIAPPLAMGIVGTGFYAHNRGKNRGYAGLGAAMAAGAKVVEKVSNKTIFAGLGASDAVYVDDNDNYIAAIAGDEDSFYEDPVDGYSIEDVDGIAVDAIL